MTPTLTPAAVELHAGIGVDNLRDWRRRKLLDGIGTCAATGRWTYSVADVVALAVARELLDQGVALTLAIRTALASATSVSAWLMPTASETVMALRENRFTLAFMDDGQPQALLFRDFRNIDVMKLPVAVTVDSMHMADRLRPRLGDLFAKEGDGVLDTDGSVLAIDAQAETAR